MVLLSLPCDGSSRELGFVPCQKRQSSIAERNYRSNSMLRVRACCSRRWVCGEEVCREGAVCGEPRAGPLILC